MSVRCWVKHFGGECLMSAVSLLHGEMHYAAKCLTHLVIKKNTYAFLSKIRTTDLVPCKEMASLL